MKDYRTLIEYAVSRGWESGAKVGIIYQVTNKGTYLEGLNFPAGSDTIKTVGGENAVLINLSLNACKQFNYVKEFKQFVYDVSVKGKPFFGNIPPNLVIDIINMDTHESFYDDAMMAGIEDAMVETPSHNFTKVKLVSKNPHITPSKSSAKLKVVH